jgi:hypothetical protein
VDRQFLSVMDRACIDTMSAAVDPRNSLFIVAVPSSNPTTQVYLYQYALRRWTTASITAERIFAALSQSTSLDALDATYGNLDAIPLPLDSALFRGGYPLLMLFDGAHRLGTLSGPNMAATLFDARKELFPGSQARIRSIRPLSDAAEMTVSISQSRSLSDMPSETSHGARSGSGAYRMHESCALAAVKLAIAGGASWSYVQGYDIEAMPGGRA